MSCELSHGHVYFASIANHARSAMFSTLNLGLWILNECGLLTLGGYARNFLVHTVETCLDCSGCSLFHCEEAELSSACSR